MKKFLAALTVGIAASSAGAPAMAQTERQIPGQWSITTKVTPSGADWNTLQICMSADHTWYSTEQRKGSGRWLMVGKRVLFHGSLEVLSVSADVAMTSATTMTGDVQQWVNTKLGADDQSNLFASSNWTRISTTCTRAV